MTSPAATPPPSKPPKDHWDKLAIVLSPVGGLLTALAVASLGFIGSRTVEVQQSNEAKLRLYSELMSRREESEATLRKEMFQSIIGSFFDANTVANVDARLLKMELLAQNFHEALNLAPLFQHMGREIARSNLSPQEKRLAGNRLSELAREITRKQLLVLETDGRRVNWTVLLDDSLLGGLKSTQLDDAELTLDGITRRFRVSIFSVDSSQRELNVSLEVETPKQAKVAEFQTGRTAVEFPVGFFSTPMIDNTRLSNDQRVAVVLTDLNSAGANLSLIYFPGSRASLREKPYYEEILRKMTETPSQ